MNTSEDRRRRRQHSPEFKAKVIAACRKPGVSIAAVALAHRLNANLLGRWVVAAERMQPAGTALSAPVGRMPTTIESPAFVPIAVERPSSGPARDIVVELRRNGTVVKVNWPVESRAAI